MKTKRLTIGVFFMCVSAITALMSSCAETTYLSNGYGTYYDTRVTSFGNYDFNGKTFYIESGDESISSNDLEFKEYAGYYAENLKIKGAKETTDKNNADICILMNYCITDESYQETIPIPIFGATSIASTTTKGSKTTYNYNYGTTGYQYIQNNVDNYVRVVNVYAYDNKSRECEPVMLWKTNFKSKGSSYDLRKVIPYMIFPELDGVALFYERNFKMFIVNEKDYLFKYWKDKKLSNSTVFMDCKNNIESSVVQVNTGYVISSPYIEKKSNETIVCLRKFGQGTYMIPELYIVCNGKEIKASYADNYKLGTYVFDESGVRYFILHFPIDLGAAKSFELREYTNSKHTKWKSWGTVELKK